MFSISKNLFLITNSKGEELTRITIEHKTNELEGMCLQGEVSALLQSNNDPSVGGTPIPTYNYVDQWGMKLDSNDYHLHIKDFILPHQLRQQGIGTICWSLIHQTFPKYLHINLLLRGELGSCDATIPSNKQAHTTLFSDHIDNIERRNMFWKRMIEPTTLDFSCDKYGNGHFCGQFVDPALHPSFWTNCLIVNHLEDI